MCVRCRADSADSALAISQSSAILGSLNMTTSSQSSANPSVSDNTLQALRMSESRYRRLFEAARDGILLLNVQTGRVEDVNPFLIDLLGYSRDECLARHFWQLGSRTDEYQGRAVFRQMQEQGYARFDYLPLRTRDGNLVAVEVVANRYDCDGIAVIQCNVRDISARRLEEATLRELAFHDPLTRLPNRRLLLDRLDQATRTSRRRNTYAALLFLDLDAFKLLNDTLGHAAGDAVLVITADRLLGLIRDVDTVARLGGDEFVILLEALGPDLAAAESFAADVAGKIRRALALPYALSAGHWQGSCSLGVVTFLGSSIRPELLLGQADRRMYLEKQDHLRQSARQVPSVLLLTS